MRVAPHPSALIAHAVFERATRQNTFVVSMSIIITADRLTFIRFARKGPPLVPSRFTQTIEDLFGARDDVAARAAHENFPVASRLLPRDIRSKLMAIYAFARLTDDIGDEAEGDRLALLDWLDDELTLAGEGRAIHPVFQRLTPVIEELNLGLAPFRSLIEANRVDQIVTRYSTFADLVDYCMLVRCANRTPGSRGVQRLIRAANRVVRPSVHCTATRGTPPRRGRGCSTWSHLSAPGRPSRVPLHRR